MWSKVLIAVLIIGTEVFSQNLNPSLYNNLRWRMIGPHRGGRTVGATGVPMLAPEKAYNVRIYPWAMVFINPRMAEKRG